jgi:hypothetical protein
MSERMGKVRVLALFLIALGLYILLAVTLARTAEARPAGCPPRAWCGCWLGYYLGVPKKDLWLARNWAREGRPAMGPGLGVVVVWRNHVGVIVGRTSTGWVVKSGNDGGAVRARERSLAGVIAFRVVR